MSRLQTGLLALGVTALLFLSGACVLFLGSGAVDTPSLAAPQQSDPEYKGRKLSSWARQFQDKDTDTRIRAREALVAIGEPSLPHLDKVLRGDDLTMHSEARGAMHLIGPAAAPYFKKDLEEDRRLETRVQAGYALMHMVKDQQTTLTAAERKLAIAAGKEGSTHKNKDTRDFAITVAAFFQNAK